ncbi:APC family permease [Phaeocystidibacter luteus]|uniref:APC family permease n=1 Tax=Phaeocystidibacter luteus TaxID=911197 RepID=A0A6N6RKL3_9FLAO|nr:APC family permease [Phaeocystidibacter luteus]KAB2807684.1 APC family permease [Phaeocystidibacter luteus]
MSNYSKNSLSLVGSIALGTGVMIGAGIFALLGQVAELSKSWFPYMFIVGAIISGFSAYSYVKVSSVYPSSGGIAMILQKAYGKTAITGGAALLMAFSMIMNESLVARTFGTYVMRLFPETDAHILIPFLGVCLIITAYVINLMGNKVIEGSSNVMSFAKIIGILVFALAAIWGVDQFELSIVTPAERITGFDLSDTLAAAALSILAFKGFTTITNSGDEITKPERNVGRSIVYSILICLVVYLIVAFAVNANLSIEEIVHARDYSLAEAARPSLGNSGVYFTIGIAIIATISGIIASLFAVSRMTTMLTEMKLIPHSHFGMTGGVHKHMLLYISLIAIVLTVLFDLSRIATIGAVFYLVMDIIIHVGVLKHLRKDVHAQPVVLIIAILLDITILVGLLYSKLSTDPIIVYVSLGGIVLTFSFEWFYLKRKLNAKE